MNWYEPEEIDLDRDAINRLTGVNDSVGGTINWTYDTVSSGHHPRVQETTAPGTVTVEYDEIGRRLKLSTTGQPETSYTYDKNSRLKTVTQGSQTVTLAYDNAGRRTSLTYPNGVVTSYGYDNANRLLTIGHVKTPTTIEALTYTYDKGGNRITQVRQNAAASNLPTAVAAANIAYDVANELTRWNSATTNLTYDGNGNLATETQAGVTTTYTWDTRNRLTGMSRTGLTASFAYDGLGRRKSKTINGTTTGFWYDGVDILAELSGSTPTATYIRSLSIDEPFIRRHAAGDEFYQTDALGSSVVLTDINGATQTAYTFEPNGATTITGISTNPFQYTGRESDATSLYYFRARYYDPKVHRFLGEDPIGFSAGDVNLYAYVGNSPINYSDVRGLCMDPGGSGLRYCVDAYIPDKDVLVFGYGDNRGPDSAGGTFRTRQLLGSDAKVKNAAGISKSKFGVSLPGELGSCSARVSHVPLGGRKIKFECEAINGFHIPPWPLKYHFAIFEKSDGSASVTSAAGTTFPNYEIWQYGGPNGPTQVYDYRTPGWVGDLGNGPQPLPVPGR
ncbi:MAG: RHS repeat-associated core domain-containing protein [Nitrospira sp.]|nr:RHS repeat-associated core domain-containing protein [Nitrospira sp.]HQY58231.1 RHS repeat-associated core domain-containing protein [Nitrospira sp.]